MVKFGIIGCGTISKWYAESIAELGDRAIITAAFDIRPEAGRAFAEKYGARYYDNYAKLLTSDIDAVCVCTPSGLHAKYVVEAANAGKNVVVEKPMGITTEQLDEIIAACNKTGVKLCAISQLYFSDAFQRVKNFIEEGGLGRLLLCDLSMKFFRSAAYYKEGNWRGTWAMDGGDALMNQASTA